MSAAAIRGVVRQLGPVADPPLDADLLTAFVVRKDTDAFAALVTRHGPNVFGVCRRVLGDSHDAEDAFQAVFLVLAQKAASVRPPGSIGGWLYGVAVRTANKAKVAAARRRRREMIAATQTVRESGASASAEQTELSSVLDQELAKLPESLRAAIILCDLHGKTRAEAAGELRCPEGTIAARLHRGRKKLAEALSRRGLAIPAAGFAAVLTPAAVPARTVQSLLIGAWNSSLPPAVLTLAREVIRSMTTSTNALVIGVLTLVVGGLFAAGGTMPSPDSTTKAPLADRQTANKTENGIGLPGNISHSGDDKARDTKDSNVATHWREAGNLDGIDDLVDSIAFTPDGKSFVVGFGGLGEFPLAMWDSKSLKKIWSSKLSVNPRFTAVATSPTGKLVAAAGDAATEFFDAVTGKAVAMPKIPGGYAIAFSPDGKWLAHSNGGTSGFQSLSENGGSASTTVEGDFDYSGAVAWSPDSLYLAYAMPSKDRDWLVGMIGVTEETKPKNLSGHKGRVTAVAWSRNGKYLASGGDDGKVIIRDGRTFAELQRVDLGGRSGKSIIHALAFAPDSRTLVAAHEFDEGKNPNRVAVLDPVTGKRTQDDLQSFGKGQPVSVAISPDGKTMLVGCGTRSRTLRKVGDRMKMGEVKIFTTEPEKSEIPKAKGDRSSAAPAAAAPKWKEKAVLKDVDDLIVSVAFDPKGKTLAAGAASGTLAIWKTDDLSNSLRRSGAIPAYVTYSPDGRYLAQTWKGGSLVVSTEDWKPLFTEKNQAGKEVAKVLEGNDVPLAIAFGPTEEIDGRKLNRLAMSDGHSLNAITWIDGASPSAASFGPLNGAPKIEGVPPAGIAYSPDGKQLVFIPNYKMPPGGPTGKPDPQKDTHWIAQIWGGGSGAPMAFLIHGTAIVTAVAWSQDGSYIATGDAEGDVALWDGKKFKEVRRMKIAGRGGKSYIHSLAFQHDGKTLAVGTTYDEGTNANRVVFFDVVSGNRGNDLQGFASSPLSLAFSPDDKTLIVGCGDRDAERAVSIAKEVMDLKGNLYNVIKANLEEYYRVEAKLTPQAIEDKLKKDEKLLRAHADWVLAQGEWEKAKLNAKKMTAGEVRVFTAVDEK